MKNNWMAVGARLSAVVTAVVVAGCAGSGGQLQGPSGAFAELKTTQANEAVVVFFREEGTTGRVPLVLTNDRVVGSLLAGRYAQARVCAGGLMAGTADRADVVGVPQYQPVAVKAGEALYLQVSETEAGKFQLKPLDAALARERLGKLQTASHIINRHVPDCTPKAVPVAAAVVPVVAPSVPVVLRRVELGADALFKFDRFGADDMLPEGRASLVKLVDDIQRNGVAVERLRLTGHTDRLGTPVYNMKLSQQRAETVGAFLRRAGLAMPIEIIGRGEQEPVTTACVGEKASPALVSCLQPDRRVTVDLIGSVKQPSPAPTR
jgi:OOP family OmpA-OmpF porin